MNIIASSQLTIIIGLGMTGMSAARFLAKKNIRFIVMDSRDNPPNLSAFKEEFPSITCITGRLDSEQLAQADEIIISPGMSLKTPELVTAIEANIPVIGDIEIFARHVDKPVIAITGSNAKSTVTTLVGDMAKASGYHVGVGGNLGVPVLELLADTRIDIFILELSSFQLETTFSLKPKVATILNVSLDHMDRYASLPDYHQAKQRVYRHAEHIVINRQDVLTQPPLARDAKVWSFGDDEADIRGFGLCYVEGQCYLSHQFSTVLNTDQLLIKGKHNFVNALSALAIGTAANFNKEAMLETLVSFKGLPHRCEYIATIKQVTYINDSKATNVGATIAALNGLVTNQPNIVLIAGGDAKEADFSSLKAVIPTTVKALVVMGRDAEQIANAVSGHVSVYYATTLVDAVNISAQQAMPGDTVLLSPACASFDMFTDFADRGNQFIHAVQELAA